MLSIGPWLVGGPESAIADTATTPAATDGTVDTRTSDATDPQLKALPTPTPTPTPTAAPVPALVAHQYGMNMFICHPEPTGRDRGVVRQAGFGWQKTLFEWRKIEGDCKGCFKWAEADRVAKATADAGLKLLVRIDFQPNWALADLAQNGKPDKPMDYVDFVSAVAGAVQGRLAIRTRRRDRNLE